MKQVLLTSLRKGSVNTGRKTTTKLATGNYLFIASIILYLGGLLLAPPTASAQAVTVCAGIHQTITTPTGVVISTCNWDLDEAPINKAAAGLEADISPSLLEVCPCDFVDAVPPDEWKKFGISGGTKLCNVDVVGPNIFTQVLGRNKRNQAQINMFGQVRTDLVAANDDRCLIDVEKGKFRTPTRIEVNNLSDDMAFQCIADVEAYTALVDGLAC